MSWQDILLEVIDDGIRREVLLCTVLLRDPPEDAGTANMLPKQPLAPLVGSAVKPVWLDPIGSGLEHAQRIF